MGYIGCAGLFLCVGGGGRCRGEEVTMGKWGGIGREGVGGWRGGGASENSSFWGVRGGKYR